jgi:hypothetical protein
MRMYYLTRDSRVDIKCFFSQLNFDHFLANDLSIANNRYISSCHCTFEYDHGHLYLHDSSSNGTLINQSKKISKTDPVKKYFVYE